MPTGYTIRFAQAVDVPAMIAADRAASEMFRPTGLIPDMAAVPESVPESVFFTAIEAGMVIIVADKAGPVGFALCRVQDDLLYLDQISVDPNHGRKGLGSALLEHVYLLAETRKLRAVTLSTFRDLEWNGPFYRRHGFRELPRAKLTEWMLEIERAQAETLDISKRCFMIRPIRRSFLHRTG